MMTEPRELKLDEEGAVFFKDALKAVRAKTYDVEHRDLKAETLIPVNSGDDPAAETIEWRSYDSVGMAKIVADYATDFPRTDILGSAHTSKVRSMGSSYGYSIQEIRRAQMANVPLESKRALAAKRAIDELQNKIAFNGDASSDLKGLFGITGANKVTVDWSGASLELGKAIVNNFANLIQASGAATNGKEQPDTILMPMWLFNKMAVLEFSEHYRGSVLNYLKESFPQITRWEYLPECAAVPFAANTGDSGLVAYQRDPNKVELLIPQRFESFAPQQQGMEFTIYCHQRTGGVVCYYPMSVSYMDLDAKSVADIANATSYT